MKRLFVVGIGPGSEEGMTQQAAKALEEAQVLCGYTKYIELVAPLFSEKPVISTGMKKETDRCHAALESASEGKTTALVCSGDAGVYGMAGLILELSPGYPEVEIEIIAGVSAAMSGAALLGSPLGHDFAVISLSDLLTPWELIEKRLTACAAADFALSIYNPRSHGRPDYLAKACDILLKHKSGETVCGWAKNIGRQGEECGTLTLSELRSFDADMFTTVFVGNEMTRLISGKMVTPRGYK